MSYITSYNTAFPQFIIADKVLHPKAGENTRTVAYTDEDIMTLAYAAACKLSSNIDAILFATTTPIFKERYHASYLADLLNIPEGITALDLGTTTRCGTDALMLANHWVDSGAYNNVLVVAADVEFPAIGKELLTSFGHAAVALIVSKEKGLAEVSDISSYSAAIAEEFQYKKNIIQYDARFARTAGFKDNIKLILKSMNADSIDSIMLNGNYSKLAHGMMKKAGFDMEKQFISNDLITRIGNTGSTHALLRIVQAIQDDRGSFALIDYANGSNVINICVTKSDTKSIVEEVQHKTLINHYQDFLAVRKRGKFESLGYEKLDLFSSEMMQEREKNQFIHLKGFECESCNTVYFLKAARCNKCKATSFKEKQLSRRGTIYSLTAEFYFPNTFPPTNMIIIDLETGGRLTVQQTDDMYQNEKSKLKIGDKVGLVLRKMMENDAKPNYFWKCVKV